MEIEKEPVKAGSELNDGLGDKKPALPNISQEQIDFLLKSHTREEFDRATLKERKRCIHVVGKYLTGEIKTQWELRDAMERGEE